MSADITLDQAKEIFANRSNGGFSGISPGKGGRCWIDGEFCLSEWKPCVS